MVWIKYIDIIYHINQICLFTIYYLMIMIFRIHNASNGGFVVLHLIIVKQIKHFASSYLFKYMYMVHT